MTEISVPGKYSEHVAATEQMMRADLWPAVNLAQTELTKMDTIGAKLEDDRVALIAAQRDHASKNQLREQAWERVMEAIRKGLGMDPGDVGYADHMELVDTLMSEMRQVNTDAEAARVVLVAQMKAVADGEAELAIVSEEHDVANRKRISVWRQVISQIESGLGGPV